MKRLLIALVLVVTVFTLLAGPALADPTNYDKMVSKGIYYLVAKSGGPDWNVLPRSTNPFGMGKFSKENDTLTMHLVCHKLTPGDWYYVELVDKSIDYDVIDKHYPSQVGDADSFSQFYGQADMYGDVDITFS